MAAAGGHEFLVGGALVLLVDVLWTSSNYLASSVLTHGYNKPFAVTYLSTASFITYLVPFAFLYVRRSGHGARKDGPRTWWEHLGFRLPPLRYPDPGRAVTADDGAETQPLCADCDGARDDAPLSIIETAALAMEFAVIWFVANWTFVMALACTSVASGTTLGSTSGFFTLLLGSMWGVETFTPGKLLTVLTSSLGVLLVTHADRVSTNAAAAPSHALLGDALALFSAVCYAGYVILLKVRIGSESRISMPLFLGFVGAFNLVAFWPLGVVLHWTGYEPFEMPHDRLMWMGVLVNMGITVVSDFAYLLAMLKSSPLFTTVGLSLTIPMALIGDSLQYKGTLHWQSGIGSFLVLLSFVGIAWAERNDP